ncbi:DUF2628 domain-containing protein [Hoeflea prorocentri]|uniref:DUF2628 domain-containing protein n=1 Tax=Hoeflea prorocentri TaxID=1922333 RepID=A0A9X3UPR8_9HYPH|nr:DUF2628 domain-containing protein [Hoeflea prorocentri]MCY6383149.1 DUF2628 domain-containing protein [Hoeflea prorocentri]MDA5400949.1 DUF2628 domain-containing protein [Hoeflea prorocentri]
MASYVVLTPPDGSDKDERAVLIRDGFSFWALIFQIFWLLWNRLWLAAAIIFFVSAALSVATAQWTSWSGVFTVAGLLVALFIALEGNGWRILKLQGRGWLMRGVIEAPNHATAEEIFFSSDVGPTGTAERPPAPQPVFGKGPAERTQPVSGPALGLLDYENRG